jgi:ABC-type antimicrobial peptide transport system permease subunit
LTLVGGLVTERFFETIGVQPLLGRTFLPEHADGRDEVVILSHGVWQRLFAGDRGVVGHMIQLEGRPYQIVGVLPGWFDPNLPEGRPQEVWAPKVLQERDRQNFAAGSGTRPRSNGAGAQAAGLLQRTHEMGVRIAMGARAQDITRLVVGEGMVLVGIGVVLGLLASAAIARGLSSFLYGVGPIDPLTLVAAVTVLSAIAWAACYLPACRALESIQ